MKILLPIDGSSYTDMSIETLKALRPPPQTEVTVMTVVPELVFLGGITFPKLGNRIVSRKRLHAAHEKKDAELLKEPIKALQASGIEVENIITHQGKPAEKIIEYANLMPADLVVIGAKGISNSRRFRLGSTTNKVMKYTNSSVLLVKEKTNKVRTVIFATDGSKNSDAVASLLINILPSKHSNIIIVTVLQSYMSKMTNLVKMGVLDADSDEKQLLSELRDTEEQIAQQIMAKIKKRFQQSGFEASSIVRHGDPAEEILRLSNSRYPDLIALGAKGLTETETFLIGSVAQRVARFSKYSVLIGRIT